MVVVATALSIDLYVRRMTMAKPLKLLNEMILTNFRHECERFPFNLANELQGDLRENKALQCTLVTLFYAYAHYFRLNPDSVDKLRAGGLFYGKESKIGHLCGIFAAPSEDDPSVHPIDILIAMDRENALTPTELKKRISNAYKKCVEFLNGLKGHSSNPGPVEHRLHDLGFNNLGNESTPITIRFLLHVIPTQKAQDTIRKLIDEVSKSRGLSVPLEILFGNDIDYEVRNTASACQFVSTGELIVDNASNVCRYEEGPCDALFANIRATSLRKIWRDKAAYGLLAQNLRFYVSIPRVDSAMLNTMAKTPNQFWYFNNGITIICESFDFDGNRLKLKNFSIVNGGQTTHNIGSVAELANDFLLPCKIIALKSPQHQPLPPDDQTEFIANVCTATNSQKPIKAADAVANRKEIRELRLHLKATPACSIYLIAKVNEKVDRAAYPAVWQRVKTSRLGQLLLSFLYQYPCTARNKTMALFEDAALFHQLFAAPLLNGVPTQPNVYFIRDLMMMREAVIANHKKWEKRVVSSSEPATRVRKNLVKNGDFLFFACIGALCKLRNNPELKNIVKSSNVSIIFTMGRRDVDYPFLENPDLKKLNALDGSFQKLLSYCLDKFIYPGYESYCEETGKDGDYSNFAKADTRYLQYVLPRIAKAFEELPDELEQLLQAVFRQPTNEELEHTNAINYENPPTWGTEYAQILKDLKKKLITAIKDIPKEKRQGAAVPNNEQINELIQRRTSLQDVHDLDYTTLQPDQVAVYGETIIRLIKEANALLNALANAQSSTYTEEEEDDE